MISAITTRGGGVVFEAFRVRGVSACQNAPPSGERPSDQSFSWPLNDTASTTRSSDVPGKYESNTSSPPLLNPNPMFVGLWNPVCSSKLMNPRALMLLAAGIIHFVRFVRSSLRYQFGPNTNTESDGLCNSSQSFESSSVAKSVCATTSLSTTGAGIAASALPGDPLMRLLARQLPP